MPTFDSNPENPFRHPLTRQQREAVLKLANRYKVPYRTIRRHVCPGAPGSFAPYASIVVGNLFIGIEPDGYTHT